MPGPSRVSHTTSEGQAVVSYDGTQGRASLYAPSSAPEVTRPLLDREIPGIAEAIRAAGVAKGIPSAMLSRGLAGLDHQRVQPEWLPAIVEPVEQPDMMAMEMEAGRLPRAIGQRQHDGTAALDLEGRGPRR